MVSLLSRLDAAGVQYWREITTGELTIDVAKPVFEIVVSPVLAR